MATLTLIVVVAIVLVVGALVAFWRRQRAFTQRFTQTLQAAVAPGSATAGGSTVNIDLSEAMRDALAKAGLPPGAVQVRTSIRTTAGPTEVVMVDSGPDRLDLSRLGVAEVLSISSLSGARVATLELDAIGEARRRVTADLTDDQPLQRGDRVYVLKDADRADVVTIAPPTLTGGEGPPTGANRLDALVLGPQILRAGAKGRGVVKAVESLPMANPALAERGFSKWRLEIEVSPEQGFPFRAELTTSLSSPQKAAMISHVGAEVPVRYDPRETKTIAIDSIAMGFGDPYEHLRARAQSPG